MSKSERTIEEARITSALREPDGPIADLGDLFNLLQEAERTDSARDQPDISLKQVYRARDHLEFPYEDFDALTQDLADGLSTNKKVYWMTLESKHKL